MKLSLILILGALSILTSCDGTDKVGNGGNTGQRGGPNSATGKPAGGEAPKETHTGAQGNEGAGNSQPASSAAGSTTNGVHQN